MKKLPCKVNVVHYESKREAATALGMNYGTLQYRVRSPNFPEYVSKYCPKKEPKRYVSCSIGGVEYKSIASASKELKLSTYEIKKRLTCLDYPDYICANIPKKPSTQFKNRHYPYIRYPCTIDGVYYESEKAAAVALGLYTSGLKRRLRSPNFPEYVSKYRPKEYRRASVSCSVAGVEYRSIGDAARDLGIHYGEMKRMLVSPDYPDYICDKYPKKFPKKYSYTVNGKKYRTLREIADLEGVTGEAIRYKMNNPKKPEYQKRIIERNQR